MENKTYKEIPKQPKPTDQLQMNIETVTPDTEKNAGKNKMDDKQNESKSDEVKTSKKENDAPDEKIETIVP